MGAASMLLTRVSVEGSYVGELLPALLLLGPGIGAVFVAGSIATLAGVSEAESGLASGLNNTSFQFGAAVGVAVLSTVAVSERDGQGGLVALTDSFHAAFATSIAFAAAGILIALALLGRRSRAPQLATATPATE